jgi:hypothetical protein
MILSGWAAFFGGLTDWPILSLRPMNRSDPPLKI